MAPRSSTIANVNRNTFRGDGTRLPSSAMIPTTKAMSVAIGMPQPCEAWVEPAITMKSSAGTAMPPSAATMGSTAARRSRSSPKSHSRLISRPITKKNTAMSPSSTKCCSVVVPPQRPNETPISVCHNVE